MALPKANRLRQRRDFDLVYRKGIRRRTKNLMLYAMKRESSSIPVSVLSPDSGSFIYPMAQLPTRIGITISQKVSKRAVVRNRIRRRIQSALRRLLTSFSTGWDLVVVVSPQASQCEYLQFLQELEQLLIDAEVLHGRS